MKPNVPMANVVGSDGARQERHMQRLVAVSPRLLAYARRHLRDGSLAEDVVQETLLAAIEKDARFTGRSAYETWVFGILKNKILDALRARKRQGWWQSLDDESSDKAVDPHFQQSGHGHAEDYPASGVEPDAILEKERFWQAVDACMTVMPVNMARILSLRELRGLSTTEICEEIGIKENNCWVTLHRARRCLRGCLGRKELLEESA